MEIKTIIITSIYLATAIYTYITAYYPAINEYIIRCVKQYGADIYNDRFIINLAKYRVHIAVVLSALWPLMAVACLWLIISGGYYHRQAK